MPRTHNLFRHARNRKCGNSGVFLTFFKNNIYNLKIRKNTNSIAFGSIFASELSIEWINDITGSD